MIISYHTLACVKVSAGDTTLVFGPVSKNAKRGKPINFGADIAFIPLNHPDMNGAEGASRGEKEAFTVFGPGEYEIKDITTAGFPTISHYDRSEKINTVYSFTFDGLSVLYLGALGTPELPAELLEIDSPDILIIPIGGEGVLTPAEAHKLAVKLEAKVIIPILYDDVSLKTFLKEAGAEGVKAEDKLTIKPRDLAGKENEVIVLSA